MTEGGAPLCHLCALAACRANPWGGWKSTVLLQGCCLGCRGVPLALPPPSSQQKLGHPTGSDQHRSYLPELLVLQQHEGI